MVRLTSVQFYCRYLFPYEATVRFKRRYLTVVCDDGAHMKETATAMSRNVFPNDKLILVLKTVASMCYIY